MAKYLDKVWILILALKYFSISYIPQCKNARADSLSRLMILAGNSLDRTYIKYLVTLSIREIEKVQQVDHEPSWMDPFIRYLIEGTILDNPPKGKKFKWKVSQFVPLDEKLHKKSLFLLLKCLRPLKVDYVLRKIHERICRNHPGARSLAYKIPRQGYYSPTI